MTRETVHRDHQPPGDTLIRAARTYPWLASLSMARLAQARLRLAAWAERLRRVPRRARRGWGRRWAAALPALVLGLALSSGDAGAGMDAALMVAAPAGAFDGVSIARDGLCSLREAIVNANNDAATHVDCAAGSAADTIHLPACAVLTVPDADHTDQTGSSGLPIVTSELVIEGHGATVRRDPTNAAAFRLFHVDPGTLTLRDATVTGGLTQGDGGAILVAVRGRLRLEFVTIHGNSAVDFQPYVAFGGDGGGVYAGHGAIIANSVIRDNFTFLNGGGISAGDNAVITGSTISGNSSGDSAGGIEARHSLVITGSTVSNNYSRDDGGGGIEAQDHLHIIDSTIVGNRAASGTGGGVVAEANMVIQRSRITGNSASMDGGGIDNKYDGLLVEESTISGNTAGGSGGGIDGFGYATIVNSTISGNTAGGDGGGLGGGGEATISSSTIVSNAAGGKGGGISARGRVTLVNSIIANQAAGADCNGAVSSSGHNIEGGKSCAFTAAGDQQDVSPAQLDLGPLAANGGPTMTHLPGPASPARDRGADAFCAVAPVGGVDQRGVARPQPSGGHCDIGAVEVMEMEPPPATPTLPATSSTPPPSTPEPCATAVQPSPTSTLPATATPSAVPATPATPTAGGVCPQIIGRVPKAVIDAALANPDQVRGFGELHDPGKPAGPLNPPRVWLSLRSLAVPYHPLANAVEYKAYCP